MLLVPNSLLDSLFFLCAILLALYNYYCMRNGKKGTGYLLFVIFIVLFSLLYRPSNGDFWGYLELYGMNSSYLEPFYNWLIEMIPDNYLLWRVAVWLPAAFFICMVFKLMKVPSNLATVFFIMYGLMSYYYTRNALALAVLYLGLALFSHGIEVGLKKEFIFLFLLFAAASWFLHRSMPIYIALALAVTIIPLNKKIIIALLIAFPLLYGVIMVLGNDFLSMSDLWLNDYRGLELMERENVSEAYNLKGIIQMIIHYAPLVYFFYIAFTKPIEKGDKDFTFFRVFLLFTFILIYVSFLFYGQGGIEIQRRLFKSSMIPFSFLVALYFKHFMNTKRCWNFLYLVLADYAVTLFVRFVL